RGAVIELGTREVGKKHEARLIRPRKLLNQSDTAKGAARPEKALPEHEAIVDRRRFSRTSTAEVLTSSTNHSGIMNQPRMPISASQRHRMVSKIGVKPQKLPRKLLI